MPIEPRVGHTDLKVVRGRSQMPFELSLPPHLKRARWRVKIREKETREPPHVTILRRTQAWRLNLRTGEFMDSEPDPRDVSPEVLDHVTAEHNWRRLCDEWDKKYPNNTVDGTRDSEGT